MRIHSGRLLGWTAVGVAVVGVAALVAAGELVSGYTLALAALGVAGYAAYVHPYVDINPGELVFANPLRTVHIPWPAVTEVNGRLGLQVTTTEGRYTAWAAPLRRRLDEDVLRQLEEHRAAGHLDDPRFERPKPTIRWNIGVVASAGLLSAFAIALALGTFF